MESRTVRQTWTDFWDTGRWWKAVLLAIGYLLVYEALSFSVTPLLGVIGGPMTASYVLVLLVIPIVLGGLVLVLFGLSTGWWRPLFSAEAGRGRAWMWIPVVAVLLFNVLRFASTDYSRVSAGWVASWLLAGLAVGFAEEVLTRGYVIWIGRSAGLREPLVAVLSAGTFALLHSVNLLGGQSLLATALQLLYTFFFGVCMYLALRVTRTLVAPILIHASTDPSITIHTMAASSSPLAAIAGLGNIVVIAVGAVAMIVLIVSERRAPAGSR